MTHLPLAGGDEFARIARFLAALGPDAAGVGDDTATIPDAAGALVVSTDTSIDEVHFRRDWLSPLEIGWRATAAALSDIAAAGAQPVGALLALSLPNGFDDAALDDLARGVAGAVRSAGCRVVGGDLTRGDRLSLTVTAFGRAIRPMSRRGARPGDEIWVSGVLGGARAALVDWLDGLEPPTGARAAFAKPPSRHRLATWLAEQDTTAMMDLSDGLAGDAPHLALASDIHLEIDLDQLPIHPSVHRVAARRGETAAAFAAVGGEDYELLFTLPAGSASGPHAEPATGAVLTRIGVVASGAGVTLRQAGAPVALQGFRHRV